MADSNYKLHGHLGVNLFGCIMVKTSVYNEAFVSMLSVIIISVASYMLLQYSMHCHNNGECTSIVYCKSLHVLTP